MPFDTFKPLENELDLARTEETTSTPVPATQDAEDDWDFWNSEYWIVRDRPPYRV